MKIGFVTLLIFRLWRPSSLPPSSFCLPYTLPTAHRLLAKSVVAPPVVVCHGEGGRKGDRRLLAKDFGFLLPVLLLLYLFGSSKSRRGVHISASFAVLRIACAPTPRPVLSLPQAGTLFAASAFASHFILAWADGVGYYLIKSKM